MLDDIKKHEILAKYFTNTRDNVYAIKSVLPPQVGAAVISRCSRTNKPLRELFWEEFLKNPDLTLSSEVKENNATQENLDAEKRAGDFFNKVLAQYGDESVGEMASISIIIEDVSPVVLKVVESMRRMAFIEVSTRYVDFRTKINDKYRYYIDKDLDKVVGEEYRQYGDKLFEKYVEWFEPVKKFVIQNNPMLESEKEASYKAAVHARTCDILRELLPIGIISNAGISGNGRDWSDLINIMLSNPLEEVRNIGKKIQKEAAKIIPNIIQRTESSHGDSSVQYLKNIRQISEKESNRFKKNNLEFKKDFASLNNNLTVKILDITSDPFAHVLASLVYENSEKDHQSILEYYKFNPAKSDDIINEIVNLRGSRFEKVPEAFESVKITVEMFGPLSAWKDLQRHRRQTQYRSKYSLNNDFYIAPELISMGLDKEYIALLQNTMDFIIKKQKAYPNLFYSLEYLTPHASNIRWVMEMDLAEAIYMIELRSSSGGHVTYRKLMHLFYYELQRINPLIAKLCKNVDLEEYYLGRRQSFAKVIEKGGTLESTN